MTRYDDDPAFFGDVWADSYDDIPMPDPTPAVDFLADLAGGGRALELAIGTGRVGLPLSQRGVPVTGIEGSPKMVDRLRAKPGGEDIPVTIGDLADVEVDGPFEVVYLVLNTLFNLRSAERQEECFRNVAKVLAPGGAFVIACYVPGRVNHTPVRVLSVTDTSATIEVYQHNPNAQSFISQKITFTEQGIQLKPHAERYASPAELDLMASKAGLRLENRYEDWDRRRFTSVSDDHVSVYRA